jgi:3',5'-cyclic AMP phosphodiesterase CpdA
LPRLPLVAVRYYGLLEEPETDFCWQFLEEASGDQYSSSDPNHVRLATRWLAALHTETASFAGRVGLRRKDTAFYLSHVQRARTGIDQHLARLPRTDPRRDLLRSVAAQCADLAERWRIVEALCAGMPEALTHGDFVRKNLRVRDGGDGPALVVFDWEAAGWGVPAMDLHLVNRSAYRDAVVEEWPDVDADAIEAAATAGRIFWHVVAIRWGARDLADEHRPAARIAFERITRHHGPLAEAMEMAERQVEAGLSKWSLARYRGGAPARPLRPITSIVEPELDSEIAFTFAVLGDGRPTLPGMPFPAVTLQAMRELALLRPAFVLYTGDAIWGYDDSLEELRDELDQFRALADSTGVPVFNAPGNHEMQSRREAIELLRDWGQDLYGSFDVGRHHFIALNTDEWCKEGRICEAQLDWLRADLADHREAEAIFVFMHRPVFSWFQGDFNPEDAQTLERLFATHPVRAVFASHDHFFHEERHGAVRYVTSGGAGSPLYAEPHEGGFAHYLLVRVAPGGVVITVIPPIHLEVDSVAGNDGISSTATARVANTTNAGLFLRNLQFRMPRRAAGQYRVFVDFVDWERKRVEHPARVARIEEEPDGTASVAVEVEVPTGTAFYVTVSARG